MPIYRITEEKEWNLLLVNLRAHNESEGDVSTLGVLERYDCREWANWVDSEFGEQVPIFLMGISVGGAVAVMSSDLELPESVCGIIDDAGFTSPLEMIKIGSKEKLRFELLTDLFARIVNAGTKIWGRFDLKEANACAAVSKTSVPVLIIHGDKDKKAPVSMAYKIYNSCKSERELYIVSEAEHTGCHGPRKMKIPCPKYKSAGRRLKSARKSHRLRLFISGFLPTFRCIRREMGLVFVQHTADHTFIDQDRLRRSRGREDQFGAGIGLSFRHSRTEEVDVGRLFIQR